MQSYDIDEINRRLSRLFHHAFQNGNEKENLDGCKCADIIQAVRLGLSPVSRLRSADKILTKWGF